VLESEVEKLATEAGHGFKVGNLDVLLNY